MKRNICFIPVRKGSKGIPGKNLKAFAGKPLVAWVLDAVIASGIADEIWIATNCDQMGQFLVSHYQDKVFVYRRSERNAEDTSPSIDVVLEFLTATPFDDSDRLILLQATSPFTHANDLRVLADEISNEKYDAFIACYRMKRFRWSETGEPLDYTFANKPRRQDYKGYLFESGAFYASTVGAIKQTGQLLSGKIKPIDTNASGAMIDIDDEDDWRMGEAYAANLKIQSK